MKMKKDACALNHIFWMFNNDWFLFQNIPIKLLITFLVTIIYYKKLILYIYYFS